MPVASAENSCGCGFSPVIYVGALGCADIYRDAGLPTEQRLWQIDTDFILANIKPELLDLTLGIAASDYDKIGDVLINVVNKTLGDLALDQNGDSAENVTAPSLNFPTNRSHNADTQFYFNYDFRLDPYIHADRLNECIVELKRITGHDKVQLKASSMGGIVLSCYLERYGYDDVETIITQCSPLWGTAVAGELFTGKFELNAISLRRYAQGALPYMEESDFIEGVIYSLTDVLLVTGVWSGLIALGDSFVNKLIDRVYDEALVPIFGSMPGIWAFVPQEYYEDSLEFMGTDKESVLYEKIASYRIAQANLVDNLTAAKNDGIKLYFVCGYNVQRTPLVSAWKNTSDGIVDTKYASLGATCADLGEELSSEYINNLSDKTYLSPDNMIDASTCAFPDNTWFLRDWLHCTGNAALTEFYKYFLTSDEQITIDNEKYPQYLLYDTNAVTLTPVTKNLTAFEIFKMSPTFLNFIRMLSEFITKLFYMLLGDR
jgi:hypothetical protein